jgi:antitoxin VapB
MHSADPDTSAAERRASLFRNGRNQAVRIPREFELEGDEVLVRREGQSLVLTPVRRHPLADLLRRWQAKPPLPPELVDSLDEIEDLPPQDRPSL